MTRPPDWLPLAQADPVPGDPTRLSAVAKRHDDLAREIEEQVGVLRRLATAEGWDADAGRAFASTARAMATELDKARRRYTAVGEALRGYAPKLEQAQREADAAARDAKVAQSVVDQNQPVSAVSGAPPATAEEQAVAQRRQTAAQDGTEALRRARVRMNNAIRYRETEAKRAAAHIKGVIGDDGLKDSWWDKVKDWTSDTWDSFLNWVHENAKTIKLVADVAGWIATGLAAVAIVLSFIPVVNVLSGPLLLAAAAVTLVSLLANTMLALSGDGSWLDVGIDLIGLVTFGYGKVASKGIKAGQQALKATATRTARKDAAKAVRRETSAAAPRGAAAGRASKAAATARRTAVRRAATREAKRTVQAATQNARPSFKNSALTLDGSQSKVLAQAEALAAVAGGKGAAAAAHQTIVSAARRTAIAGGIGLSTDVASKAGAFDPLKPPLTLGRYSNS